MSPLQKMLLNVVQKQIDIGSKRDRLLPIPRNRAFSGDKVKEIPTNFVRRQGVINKGDLEKKWQVTLHSPPPEQKSPQPKQRMNHINLALR